MLFSQAGLMARRAEHADVLAGPLIERLEADVLSALRRKPAHEGRYGAWKISCA